jgi:hypothetical protein
LKLKKKYFSIRKVGQLFVSSLHANKKRQWWVISLTCHSFSHLERVKWLYFSYSYTLITFWKFPFFPFTIRNALSSLWYVPACMWKHQRWLFHQLAILSETWKVIGHTFLILTLSSRFENFHFTLYNNKRFDISLLRTCFQAKKVVMSYFINLPFFQPLKKS